MKITGSVMPSGSVNETSKITSDSSSLILKIVRTGQGLKNNVPSFSIQLIFGHFYEQSQTLEPICALVSE